MLTAHQKRLEAIRMASPERPYTVDYDFLDMVQQSYPDIYKMIQQDMKKQSLHSHPRRLPPRRGLNREILQR